MTPEISERSFEEAIECALLRHGPDACAGDSMAVRETGPGPLYRSKDADRAGEECAW